jgi:hypothetical protein
MTMPARDARKAIALECKLAAYSKQENSTLFIGFPIMAALPGGTDSRVGIEARSRRDAGEFKGDCLLQQAA